VAIAVVQFGAHHATPVAQVIDGEIKGGNMLLLIIILPCCSPAAAVITDIPAGVQAADSASSEPSS